MSKKYENIFCKLERCDNMHKVTMTVSIPDEEWEAFKESMREAGEVQFKYRNSTIFAEVL